MRRHWASATTTGFYTITASLPGDGSSSATQAIEVTTDGGGSVAVTSDPAFGTLMPAGTSETLTAGER